MRDSVKARIESLGDGREGERETGKEGQRDRGTERE
jgi:hypothetical protein